MIDWFLDMFSTFVGGENFMCNSNRDFETEKTPRDNINLQKGYETTCQKKGIKNIQRKSKVSSTPDVNVSILNDSYELLTTFWSKNAQKQINNAKQCKKRLESCEAIALTFDQVTRICDLIPQHSEFV